MPDPSLIQGSLSMANDALALFTPLGLPGNSGFDLQGEKQLLVHFCSPMTRVLFTKPLQKSQLQPTIKASLGFYFALGCNCRMHSCLRVTLAQLTETINVSTGGRALHLKVFFLSWMGIGHLDCMVNLYTALVLVSEKSMLKGHPAGLIVW